MRDLNEIRRLHKRKPELVRMANELVQTLLELKQTKFPQDDQQKRAAWEKGGKRGKAPKLRTAIPQSAQWQNLRTVVAGAACLAEVENYLVYQAGREVWDSEVVEKHVGPKLRDAAKRADGKGEDMEALKLFVGFLVRAVAPILKEEGREDSYE